MPNSYTSLHYHVIFGTKNRAAQITSSLRDRLYAYIGGIIRDNKGTLVVAGGMPDHVHLLITTHPTTAVADLLCKIKSVSSKWVHETFEDMGQFGWRDGYSAFTASLSNVERVKKYILGQKEHHRNISFKEEFIVFLDRHGLSYDERYLGM